MPFEIREEDNGAKVITRYYGELTTDDLNQAYAARFTDEDKIKKYKIVWTDYTDVTSTSIDDVNVMRLAEIYKNASLYNPNVIAVAIMHKDLLYGMGRMWQAHLDEISWVTTVVRTSEEAQEFVDKSLSSD